LVVEVVAPDPIESVSPLVARLDEGVEVTVVLRY